MKRTRPPFIKTPGDGRKRFGDTELTQAFETNRSTTSPSLRQIVAATTTATSTGGCSCDTTELEASIAALLARIEALEDAVDAIEEVVFHSLDFSKSMNSFYFPLVG
jgi:hypothetical protein